MSVLKAPFPYFGAKSTVASLVWSRLGSVQNYVEPFFGSGAMLLGNPARNPPLETVNDLDALLSNFWRSVKLSPEAVAEHADYPVIENDLHARHDWLINQKPDIREQLQADPEWHDPKAAGWWVWGISCWIGGGWCENSYKRKPHLGDKGQGVHRKSLGQKPHLGGEGQGQGVHAKRFREDIYGYMQSLSDRFRHVRVCCGDWSRVVTPSVTTLHGTTGVFLDPPYGGDAGRDNGLYAEESKTLAGDVLQWCKKNGQDKLLRIAICGYEGEHDELEALGWEVVAWKAQGGMGNRAEGRGKENKDRERIWFSPHCIRERGLFD